MFRSSVWHLVFCCMLDMRQHVIYPDRDIKFTGHVTWVGKTSIEAKMHMSQVGALIHIAPRRHFTDTVSLHDLFSSAMMEFTTRFWMLLSSWWPGTQRTRGRRQHRCRWWLVLDSWKGHSLMFEHLYNSNNLKMLYLKNGCYWNVWFLVLF